MKLRMGPPPEDDSFHTERTAWRSMREPGAISLQLLGVVVAVVVGLTISGLLFAVYGETFSQVSWLVVIALIIPVMPVHEILHAALIPGSLFTRQITFGFSPKMLGFYTFYHGVLSRKRFLLVAAGPFVFLTVVPLVSILAFSIRSPLLIEIAIANGMASAFDIVTILFVQQTIPAGAQIKNSGTMIYWRPAAKEPLESDAG